MRPEDLYQAKDLYQVLGIAKEASQQEIKKSYRKLVLEYHPDKREGGNNAINNEIMARINEAYEKLSDPAKRSDYDKKLSAFSEVDENNIVITDYITAGDNLPYSQKLREQHKALIIQYQIKPLPQGSAKSYFKPFNSDIYNFAGQNIFDIFSFIKVKETNKGKSLQFSLPKDSLSLVLAVKIFMDFLAGNYIGEQLLHIKGYMATEIKKLKSSSFNLPELALYEGIFEVIAMVGKGQEDQSSLLSAIKKITDFAKKTSEASLACLIPLFYNKYFRNLFSYALHLNWQANANPFTEENLKLFDGRQEAKELINILKEVLSRSEESDDLISLIQYVRLLSSLEKDLHNDMVSKKASDYREKAFHLLDWMPALMGRVEGHIMANIFLQIGINFQQASFLETDLAIKMADEELAFRMYCTAVTTSKDCTPDLDMYVNVEVLRYLAGFKFQDKILQKIIPDLQERTLSIADIFPFIEEQRSNITLFRQYNKGLHLMRRLLNAMVEIIEYNKTHEKTIPLDHAPTTVLYQAYEACLKNWYQEEYEEATEQKFRLSLIEELLFANSWTFLDVERNIASPYIMVARDENGWMKPTRSLPYMDNNKIAKYKAIKGAEVNNKTGAITFFIEPWQERDSVHQKLFTLFDLEEMLQRKLAWAYFSLDPVDPKKAYHPFNMMSFKPLQLADSELLNTMLLTDYVLKFLTTGQEAQGEYPFAQRPVANMIKHLPAYLQKIVEDFHAAQHRGAIHRFWIEAGEIDLSRNDVNDALRLGLGDLKMIVKKHVMKREINGELQDVGDEDEGWPIYVLSKAQLLGLEQGLRVITGHAMIFVDGTAQLCYWENNKAIYHHTVAKDHYETLIRLYKQARDKDGKIIVNYKNMPLIYRVTNQMASQTGLSHRYSAEFIFAHEFTTHYDEFAQYLPEFGRLKELSKITALLRYLNGVRKSYKYTIKELEAKLYDTASWREAERKIEANIAEINARLENGYKTDYQDKYDNLTAVFARWKQRLAEAKVEQRQHWTNMRREMEPMTFSSYSSEVTAECQERYDFIKERTIREHGYSGWDQVSGLVWRDILDPQREKIARDITEGTRNAYRNNLNKLFAAKLESRLGKYSYKAVIESFLDNDIEPLIKALADNELEELKQQIKKQLPDVKESDISYALEGYSFAITDIARQITDKEYVEVRASIEKEIAAMRHSIVEAKDYLREEIKKHQKLKGSFEI